MKYSLLKIKQITRIFLVFFALLLCVPCAAQSGWKSAFNAIAKFGGQMLLGAADEIVQKSNNISEKDKETFSSLVNSSGYASNAGRDIVKGDYVGSATSALAGTAELMGVDSDIVRQGYDAANRAMEGDYYGAGLDVAQLSMNAAGDHSSDLVFNTYRQYNDIKIEYNKDIKSGMSEEEAFDKKKESIVELIENTQEELASMRRAKKMKEREEAQQEELGWTNDELELLQSLGVEPSYTDVDGNTHEMSSVDDFGYFGALEIDQTVTPNEPEMNLSDESENENSLNDTVEENNINTAEKNEAIISINETKISGYRVGDVKFNNEFSLKLDNIVEVMNQYKDIELTIYGHTCDIGTKEKNEIVGTARAQAVKDYLINHGINGDRIIIENKDYTCPLVENIDEEHRKQNRRVEFMAK